MNPELRSSFHNRLDELDHKLELMFLMVADSLAMAAEAQSADDGTLLALAARDGQVDVLRYEVEEIVEWQLARQQAMGRDLRLLLTAVHIAPELERSHDLVVLAARHARALERAGDGPRADLTSMAIRAAAMWRVVTEAYRKRDPRAAAHLEERDGALDDLQHAVITGLAGEELDLSDAVALVLLARFYERLGDHAVHLATRIRFLALGSGS